MLIDDKITINTIDDISDILIDEYFEAAVNHII